MKKTLIICSLLITISQSNFAQISVAEVVPLVQSSFLYKSVFNKDLISKKGGKFFIRRGMQLQKSLPSFGYVTTNFYSENCPFHFSDGKKFIYVSVHQQLDSIRLRTLTYRVLQRDKKNLIAFGVSYRSCTDSLFYKMEFTTNDFIAFTKLRHYSFVRGRFELINDDESEVRFNYYDEDGTLRDEIYFPNRNPDSLKLKIITTKYSKPRNHITPKLSRENVEKLIKNSLLQNIIFTRIIGDSVLLNQLSPYWKCMDIDELPLSIVPSFQEELYSLRVVPIDWRIKDESVNRIWSMITAGHLKREIEGHTEYNGYQFFILQRLKSAPIVINSLTHKSRHLNKQPTPTPPPDIQPQTKKPRPKRLRRPLPRLDINFLQGCLRDELDKCYNIYLIAYHPETNDIYFLSGNDICLSTDIDIYAPNHKTYLTLAEWPERNQLEFIQDRLFSLQAQNLSLDEVQSRKGKLTGTVSVMLDGERVTKKIAVDLETPYAVRFY